MLLDIFVWSSWVTAAFSTGMAVLVLFSRPLTRVKFWWAVSCTSVAGWAMFIIPMTSASSRHMASTGLLFVNVFSILIPSLFLHTIHSLLEIRRWYFLVLSYCSAAFLIWTDLAGRLSTITSTAPFGFHFYNSRLWPFDLFVVHFTGLFLLTELLVWRTLKKTADPRKRSQLNLMLWGIGIGVIGGETTIPLVYGIHFYPVGAPFIPAYIIAIGWAMLRYQFLDFRIALRRFSVAGLVYLASGFLLVPVVLPAIVALRQANHEVMTASLTIAVSSALFIMSGPFFYLLLVRQSSRLRTFLSAGFSHDIRSPLASIESAANMIRSLVGNGHLNRSRIVEYARMIERNARRLDQFSIGMIALMKSDDGREHPRSSIQVAKDVRDIIADLKPLLTKKNLNVDVVVEPSVSVKANSEGFRSVLSNLLSNAIRHSENSCIRVTASINQDEVAISVCDEGSGLSPGDKPKVFERFYQGKRKQSGTGLGLMIAQSWVEAHGGRIWAESEGERKGTTVTFTLPVN